MRNFIKNPILDSLRLKNQSGAAMMEFGLISPVVVLMLLGTMDVGHSYYVRSILDGAMQDAARASSLEGATSATRRTIIDEQVKSDVLRIAPNAEIKTTRRFYKTFSEAAAAKAEEVVETGKVRNKKCDPGEFFIDKNNNDTWDEDGGNDGQGGGNDVVIIKVKVKYPRLFPMAQLLGASEYVNIDSNSILANQPYGYQDKYSTARTLPCD
jgi:Flp pilus assembly pilin Flp